MAIFDQNLGMTDGFSRVSGTSTDIKRTNTKLGISDSWDAAEKWIVDTRLARLFQYQFGGPGWVVIPKGRIVAIATNGGEEDNGLFRGYGSRMLFNAITFANGGVNKTMVDKNGNNFTNNANRPIGVASFNIYEQNFDDMADILPRVLGPGNYIELPYISSKELAEAFHWGSAYGSLMGGDYVCSDENGRFVKWEEYPVKTKVFETAAIDTTSGSPVVCVDEPIKEVVSVSIITVDGDEEVSTPVDGEDISITKYSTGEISFAGNDVTKVVVAYRSAVGQGYDQIIGQVYATDLNLPPEGWLKWVEWTKETKEEDSDYTSLGLRPDDKYDGYPYTSKYRSAVLGEESGQGIPGLTNGSQIEVAFTNEKIGEVQAGVAAGTTHHFYLKHKPAVAGSLTVKIGDTAVSGDDLVYFDPVSALVIIKNATQLSAKADVTATYRATGQIPGLPTNRDWNGSLGAVRIMLIK